MTNTVDKAIENQPATGTLALENGLHGANINPPDIATRVFDYIICGAGSAGCVLANRLSANGAQVLLIEAGGPDNTEMISTPIRLIELWGTQYDWGYSTVPQTHAKGRQLYWPRGKTLGGSSSLNAMIYVRGNASDYDEWAEKYGCKGWDYKSVLPYFKKSEDFSRGGNEFHGAGGLLHVTADYEPHPLTKAMVEASQQAGYAYNDDTNGKTQEGVAYVDLTTKDGKRASTAMAFLRPALERSNLTLITNARVQRIEVENKRAHAVIYKQADQIHSVRAKHDIIVSGGAIESPRILMLSGIGPKSELEAVGIKSVHDLPGVGKNLHDHTMASVIYESKKEIPQPQDMSVPPMHAHLFIKSDPALPGADIQPLFFYVPYYTPEQEQPTMNAFSLVAAGVRPTSRGSITLRSADPDDTMNIDPQVLQTKYDVDTLVKSIKQVREIALQPALNEWRGREIYPGPDVQTDAQLEDFARSVVVSYHHQNGTCKMGVDDMAVVDPQLRVRGIEGLRVVDASIFPAVVAGNTNAPTIMVAEKAADMILQNAQK